MTHRTPTLAILSALALATGGFAQTGGTGGGTGGTGSGTSDFYVRVPAIPGVPAPGELSAAGVSAMSFLAPAQPYTRYYGWMPLAFPVSAAPGLAPAPGGTGTGTGSGTGGTGGGTGGTGGTGNGTGGGMAPQPMSGPDQQALFAFLFPGLNETQPTGTGSGTGGGTGGTGGSTPSYGGISTGGTGGTGGGTGGTGGGFTGTGGGTGGGTGNGGPVLRADPELYGLVVQWIQAELDYNSSRSQLKAEIGRRRESGAVIYNTLYEAIAAHVAAKQIYASSRSGSREDKASRLLKDLMDAEVKKLRAAGLTVFRHPYLSLVGLTEASEVYSRSRSGSAEDKASRVWKEAYLSDMQAFNRRGIPVYRDRQLTEQVYQRAREIYSRSRSGSNEERAARIWRDQLANQR